MAISCNNCGYAYNPNDANQCEICGAPIQRGEDSHDIQGEISLANHSPETGYISDPSVFRPHPSDQPTQAEPAGAPPAIEPMSITSSGDTIYGKISHIERHDERPRTDVYRVLARIMIGILLFIPYAVFFVVFGVLSFAFAFLGFSGLSQLLNPLMWTTSLFEFLEVMVLRRIHRTDVFPVYRGLIEDQTGRESTFVFRGPLALGNLVEGHSVRLHGRWRRGTFLAHEGQDMTTGSEIVSAYRNPWRVIFIVLVCLYLALGIAGYLYLQRLS